jgi:ribosomal protein L12E/L44/L45/RPP1/RPP2
MSNTARLTIECTPELVKTARVLAALRGVTMRELITGMIEDAAKAHPVATATMPTATPPPTGAPTPNPELERALTAQLEQQVERGKAEHERRVAAGLIKG